MSVNDQLVLISGESGSGKSASLRNIPNPEGVLYLCTEAGKRLPFKNTFQTHNITDPMHVLSAFDFAKGNPNVHTVVIDTITFLMDQFESQYIIGQNDTQKAWSNYAQFFKELMQKKVAESDKAVLILAHTRTDLDEKAGAYTTSVPIKGALKNNGVESYFSCVVAARKVSITELETYGSDLLTITDQERSLGFKHVFQTQVTKGTIGSRIRGPMGLFTPAQTYIDNDAGLLLRHLHDFYS